MQQLDLFSSPRLQILVAPSLAPQARPSPKPPLRLFRTTRATLTKHPDSMLAAMFWGDMQATALRDEAGHPFLDR